MKRDSFIFYRSFFEATNPLTNEQKWELFNAICEYSLNQNETKMEPMVNAFFTLIKPQLDANNKKYINWLKWWRPAKKKPKQNQNESKAKGNVNENDNVNDNEKDIYARETRKRELLEKYIDRWNSVKPFGIKKKWLPKCRWIKDNLAKVWNKKMDRYEYEEIVDATNAYVIAMDKVEDSSYADHRFGILDFLKQSNGLDKYFNHIE